MIHITWRIGLDMEDGGRWISEYQDETYFIWQGDLSIELPVALGHRPVDGFWPRRTTWSGGGGTGGSINRRASCQDQEGPQINFSPIKINMICEEDLRIKTLIVICIYYCNRCHSALVSNISLTALTLWAGPFLVFGLRTKRWLVGLQIEVGEIFSMMMPLNLAERQAGLVGL